MHNDVNGLMGKSPRLFSDDRLCCSGLDNGPCLVSSVKLSKSFLFMLFSDMTIFTLLVSVSVFTVNV